MKAKDYSIRQIFELFACTGCRLCVDVCPAVAAAEDSRLSPLHRLDQVRRNMIRRGALSRLLRLKGPSEEELRDFGRTVFQCTLCANCREVCPVGLGLKDLWCSVRQDMVHSQAYPAKIDSIRANLDEYRNVFGEDNSERTDWVENLPEAPEDGFQREQAKVVYFTGCVAAFYPLGQKMAMAVAGIFDRLGVDFTLLGAEEWCCGFPLLGAGLKEGINKFVEHNLEAVHRKKADTVVFSCPSCYQMWREYYPSTVRLLHVTEFISDLLTKQSPILDPLPLKVTYHDPCDLGRGARVFEAPRRLIQGIPGVQLVEMARNRENCLCCGGGGNLEMIAPDLSTAITRLKIEEALRTGAEAVITSCQQCVRTMTTYVRRNDVPLEIMDVTGLVLRALKK